LSIRSTWGTIGLPDIQRPFVWKTVKVRDLFDSMYRVYPVGYLLFWENMIEPGARQIGTDGKQLAPQAADRRRATAAHFAVRSDQGKPIVNSDFKQAKIRIAFRPTDHKFEVTNPAIEKKPRLDSRHLRSLVPRCRIPGVREGLPGAAQVCPGGCT
jgi:hypothetical protein